MDPPLNHGPMHCAAVCDHLRLCRVGSLRATAHRPHAAGARERTEATARMNTSRIRRRILSARAVVLAATIGACGGPLAPSDVPGLYTLKARDGAPLPVLVYSGGTIDIFVISETLRFFPARTGLHSAVHEHRAVGGGIEVQRQSREFSYEVIDDRIEITMICGPLENCTPPPHLVLYRFGEGLRTMPPPRGPPMLWYARVPDLFD